MYAFLFPNRSNRSNRKFAFIRCLSLPFAIALICCVFGGALADARENTYPPGVSLEELTELVKKAPKTHPRLFIHADELDALRRKSEKNALNRSLKEAIVHQADVLLDDAPIERKLQGKRLLGQSRRCVQRVVALAMAYQLTEDAKYAERCKKEMLAAASFEDWNPSHFLDVAEMTFALAFGYDWLYNQLDDDSRLKIRDAIIHKGVELPFETKHNGWVRSSNNWGQVCHGGLLAGAFAVLEDEPELAAKTAHSALKNVTRSMEAFAPKGSYPEGPGYWSYGTSYNVLLIGVLDSVLGSDFGLSLAPGFDRTGQYLSVVTGPSGQTFNYADGGAGRGAKPAVFWFASKFDRPDWSFHEYDLLEKAIDTAKRSNRSTGERLFPMTLLWMGDKPDSNDIKIPLHWSSGGHVPITIHRSSWTDPNAVFVGVKAGSPSANHGNMDTGSFVMDADGVRWAMDLGAESYHGIESRGMDLWNRSQDSDRWTIFRQQNLGHNTLVIDGQLQVVKNAGTFVGFSDSPIFAYSIVDLSPVYEGQAKSVKRGVALLPSNEVLIRDELSGLKPNAKVRWGMITKGKPGEPGEAAITLGQSDKTLRMANLTKNHPAQWRIVNTEKPRNEWDSPNRGTCMVALEKQANADGTLTFTVLMTPGSCERSVMGSLDVKALGDWE